MSRGLVEGKGMTMVIVMVTGVMARDGGGNGGSGVVAVAGRRPLGVMGWRLDFRSRILKVEMC
jgi:hypothetical protein